MTNNLLLPIELANYLLNTFEQKASNFQPCITSVINDHYFQFHLHLVVPACGRQQRLNM